MSSQKSFYLFGGSRNMLTTISRMGGIIRGVNKVNPTVAFVGVASLSDNWLIYFIFSILMRAGCR